MNVNDLARRAGVPPHVVRYYTQRGLLEPQRNLRNGYREYTPADLYRLRFICRAKLVGFTLGVIGLILRDADAGTAPCPKVRRLVQRRANDNEEGLAAAARLQARIRAAMELWETMPDRPPDHESLCRLIDAIAVDAADDDGSDAPHRTR
jgi:DNA-binding transcriptional MerR regulator